MEIKLRSFESQLHYFNGMYKLPIAPYPTTISVVVHEKQRSQIVHDFLSGQAKEIPTDKEYLCRRLKDLKKILVDEVAEVDDILASLDLGKHEDKDTGVWKTYTELDFLTDMADWLGDIQVYCGSEMVKYGIPQAETLRIIMSSNFSKLDKNGEPIYDTNGKVSKGPMYWKPEPQIRAMLEATITERNSKEQAHGIVWGPAK